MTQDKNNPTQESTAEPKAEQPTPGDTKQQGKKDEATHAHDQYIRLYADFENYKKRMVKEQLNFLAMANKELFLELIPVVNDLYRALEGEEALTDVKRFVKGMEMIHANLLQVLRNRGLTPIEVLPGATFNPEEHQAISAVDTDDPSLQGKVVRMLERGYKLHNKPIYVAKVILGK